MAGTIKISPDEMRQVSTEFKNAGQQTEQLKSQLKNRVSAMDANWDGMAADKFYQDYTQYETEIQKAIELLNTIGERLNQIAQTLEQADQAAAGR